jgi:hypothetical protein
MLRCTKKGLHAAPASIGFVLQNFGGATKHRRLFVLFLRSVKPFQISWPPRPQPHPSFCADAFFNYICSQQPRQLRRRQRHQPPPHIRCISAPNNTAPPRAGDRPSHRSCMYVMQLRRRRQTCCRDIAGAAFSHCALRHGIHENHWDAPPRWIIDYAMQHSGAGC